MTPFHEMIAAHPPFFEPERARLFFDDLLATCSQNGDLSRLLALIEPEGRIRDLLISVMGASPFLRRLMLRHPEVLQDCLTAPADSHLDDLCARLERDLAVATGQSEAMKLLRLFKRNSALAIALYDIAQVYPVERIIAMITDIADCAVRGAVSFLYRQNLPASDMDNGRGEDLVATSGYFVMAMGKQGGRELNYSSDIDLIILYDADRVSLPEGIEMQPFFLRMTRDLVRLLNERTSDGYVFRTDLRLRPDPGATQLVMSSQAALVYYENHGQNWERAAMIKARVIAGDRQAGKLFLEQLFPYIWRKYLDFAAINDIHAMKRQIHAFKGHGEIALAGHNIKLGRGGIREIEFFVQTQQLIAGGRQPALRGRSTLDNLQLLCEHGWIDEKAARQMAAAYRFLRHVEHRLQMLEDAQTQTLPEKSRELERIARFCGFAEMGEFAAVLLQHMNNVQSHYGALFEDVPTLALPGNESEDEWGDLVFTGDDHDPATRKSLAKMGYENPDSAIAIVQDWHRSRYAAMSSQRAREALTELTPLLLTELAKTAHPDGALIAFDGFLKRLPAGVQLFSLLHANPQLLRLLADIMGMAPRLARVLSHRAGLLDGVLDPSFFGPLPSRSEMDAAFEAALNRAVDYSEILDQARIIGREQAFLIGVRVLSDTISPDQAGHAYSELAASSISHLHKAAAADIAASHGDFSSGGACVLAMGKAGGGEMTASSDLDLIVIYEVPQGERLSQGTSRPLAVSTYFNRLTQRLIAALAAPTPEGMLYEVDMRLRPSGSAGPVATGLESFAIYQREQAWTWEHMALTRGRVVSGPAYLAKKINEIIRQTLCMKRDRLKVARDVVEMRRRIFAQKGSRHIWDLKQVRGGLVDLEFVAQFLQLVHASDHPECLDQNTAAALRKLASAGVLEWDDAEQLVNGAWLLHTLTQILRLCDDQEFDREKAPEGLKNLLVQATQSSSFASLEDQLARTQTQIFNLFEKLVVANS